MEWILFISATLSLFIWLYLIALRGWFWRGEEELDPDEIPDPETWPGVVALVPARDEAEVIGDSLKSLLTQDYAGDFRVIVIDDESEDGTAEQATAAATATGQTARLTVVKSEPSPPGWTGKVWALAQGRKQALIMAPEAQYLWLTDADISHWSYSLRSLVAKAEAEKLDMVSLMAMLSCDSFWERLLIPPFIFFFQKLYPFRWVNDRKRSTAAAAGGCILVDAEALEDAGGFKAIKGALIDDCALAERLKPVASKRGRGIWLGLGDEAQSIRTYEDLWPIWRMVARTAYTQLDHSPKQLALSMLGMALTYLAPPIAVLLGTFAGLFLDITQFGITFLGLVAGSVAWGLMVAAVWPTLMRYEQPIWLGLLLPVAALLYMFMTLHSALQHRIGRGGQWKGRRQAAMAALE
jgi:hopene-associated glycosyltransferase HpnB